MQSPRQDSCRERKKKRKKGHSLFPGNIVEKAFLHLHVCAFLIPTEGSEKETYQVPILYRHFYAIYLSLRLRTYTISLSWFSRDSKFVESVMPSISIKARPSPINPNHKSHNQGKFRHLHCYLTQTHQSPPYPWMIANLRLGFINPLLKKKKR